MPYIKFHSTILITVQLVLHAASLVVFECKVCTYIKAKAAKLRIELDLMKAIHGLQIKSCKESKWSALKVIATVSAFSIPIKKGEN